MTSHILQTELLNLIQESKRKNSDLRNAAEQSLNELKALPSTSETQLAADLIRKPQFVKPFVLACHSRHPRLAGIGVVCLQRLVASRSLPPERLKDVLCGLHETTSLGVDVQLKLLQTLSSLFQQYANDLNGALLASTLEICAALQNTKAAAVSNTAAATLQQLVVSVFEKVLSVDENSDTVPTATVSIDDVSVQVSLASYDAYRILDDLCRLVEGEKLEFLQIKSLSRIFVLELIESVLISNGDIFTHHRELAQVLRNRLMPLTVRYLSERHTFPLTVRVARILLLLLKRHLPLLTAECEMALGLLTHLLDADAAAPWKRVLCMEIFRGLYCEPGLIRLIYVLFDEQEGHKNILQDNMASLVRLAAEKPSLIGVSHKSTLPTGPGVQGDILEEQVALEAGGVAGVIGSPVTSTNAHMCGISSQWSLLRTAYIETLDKLDAPTPPDTYIYSLVLNCISGFSESIAKFILPLTVAESKSKRKLQVSNSDKEDENTDPAQIRGANSDRASRKSFVPVNPLDLKSHPHIVGIRASAAMIDSCWPAILATCSTFLYAALDGEFYHNLVRSFQKLTHVAGLLRLSTPRDAFLTRLGKAAVPADLLSVTTTPAMPTSPDVDHAPAFAAESPLARSPSMILDGIGQPIDGPSTGLSTRNLLCLRALVNLGIALGPTLDRQAWSIILESLQNAELVIGISTVATPKATSISNLEGERGNGTDPQLFKINLGAEIMAVQTAAVKMFESTGDYPNTSFKNMLLALLSLSASTEKGMINLLPGKATTSLQAVQQGGRIHQNKRSISIALGRSRIQEDELKFVLEKTNDLAKANIHRFSSPQDEEGIWHILADSLIAITQNRQISHSLRSKASDVLNNIIFNSIKLGNLADVSARNQVQLRGLLALKAEITTLYASQQLPKPTLRASDFEVHELALETLKSVLEQCGESLVAGWDLVFQLISSVFDEPLSGGDAGTECSLPGQAVPRDGRALVARSSRLVRTAYNSLQLVASDFLNLLPAPCLLELVESFSNFASQKEDFNISLTTTTFFWNISDFLRSQVDRFSIEGHIDAASNRDALTELAKSSDLLISRNSLWLLLLLRIADLTTDSRSEIRNSAIQTILRIFDAYGQQLPPQAWHLYLHKVLFVMAESIRTRVVDVVHRSNSSNFDDAKSWVETTVVMTTRLTSLITNFFDVIMQDADFNHLWKRLLRYFDSLIKVKLLELSESVFSCFSEVLSQIHGCQDVGLQALEYAWSIWAGSHPVLLTEPADMETPNQDALLAYLRSFKEIYRLMKDTLTEEHMDQILENLRLAIWKSIPSRYSLDIDHQSELQSVVIGCLKMFCLDRSTSQPAIVVCLAEFSDCALTKCSAKPDKHKPTFVAFSKESTTLLGWYIADHGIRTDIFSDGSLCKALGHLANPIKQKYNWSGKDREPALWQIATTAALDVINVTIPYVEKQYRKSDQQKITRFWKCIVDISRGIISANGYTESNLPATVISADEAFDIEAFDRLRALIIPCLGSPFVPDEIRRHFTFAVFNSSLIHPLHRLDLPGESIEQEPLRDLFKIRMGRTYDPPPIQRSRMAYVLIDTLFDLAAARPLLALSEAPVSSPTTASSEAAYYISLAKSASPYLILRSSVTLKSYIADQPLRGLMPQPTSARRELLYLLHQLVDLKSEPAAIPDAGPSVSLGGGRTSSLADKGGAMYRKHLGWIYPLVVLAVQIAGREREDNKVLKALGKVLDTVGGRGAEHD